MKSFSSSPARYTSFPAPCPAAADFLRSDGRISAILPAAARLVALQKDCVLAMPQAFTTCGVLKLEDSVLTLSAPSAAAATRLKQNLPSLREKLGQAGWRIDAIKVKVQLNTAPAKKPLRSRKTLPPQAVSSLARLQEQIAKSGNLELAQALSTMLDGHKSRR